MAKDKDEVKPGEPSKDDTFNYKRDSVKTMRQIAKEAGDRAKKRKLAQLKKEVEDVPTKVDKTPDKQVEESKEKEVKPEVKEVKEPKIDVGEVAKKAAEEAALKVAEQTRKDFQAEVDKILNKDKDMLEKQKEAEALIASWDKEKRLPKDYKELISETQRITEAKWEQKAKADQLAKEVERKSVEEKAVKDKAELDKKQGDEKLAEFQKQIANDLDEIYQAKLLPRPSKFEEVNNPDTKDENAKLTQKVLQFGVELNKNLVKEGKPPVTSFSKIFFLHYQPYIKANPPKEEQPPGADAPIAGGRNTPTGDSSKIDYKTLHNESFRQIAARVTREAIKKAINR